MLSKLFIPEQIHVGYQERSGTYTGKLAYVIYTDNKGVKRKEKSWESWRSKEITPDDIKNEPTEGFVLNRGVGGQRESWGWNARNEYIRVYDPRGFEFEISVANLLFILQETNSIKGKGLDGEFVYSWDGKELVLLPVTSFEYKTSTEFTSAQSKKVTKKEMNEGWTYVSKSTEDLVYIGRLNSRSRGAYYSSGIDVTSNELVKKHIFFNRKTERYEIHNGFTKLSEIKDSEVAYDFSDLYEDYINSVDHSEFSHVEWIETESNHSFFVKIDDKIYGLDYNWPRNNLIEVPSDSVRKFHDMKVKSFLYPSHGETEILKDKDYIKVKRFAVVKSGKKIEI